MKKMKLSDYAKSKGVTVRTVRNWYYKGLVKFEWTPTNRVMVIIDEDEIKKMNVAVYARVSSSENKSNLETQKQRLISYANARGYNVSKCVVEIGSGLNDNRPKLEKLLTDTDIDIIIVEHKDRLARFGINYIQKILNTYGRRIEIINDVEDNKEDLIQDFISIITSFCSRIYGQRRSKRKTEKIIEELNIKN